MTRTARGARHRFVASTFSSKWWRQGKEYPGKRNTGKRVLPFVSNAKAEKSWQRVTSPRGRKMLVAIP